MIDFKNMHSLDNIRIFSLLYERKERRRNHKWYVYNDHDEETKLTLVHLASCRNFSVKRREAFKMSFKELAIKIMRLNRRWGRRRGQMGVREKVSLWSILSWNKNQRSFTISTNNHINDLPYPYNSGWSRKYER